MTDLDSPFACTSPLRIVLFSSGSAILVAGGGVPANDSDDDNDDLDVDDLDIDDIDADDDPSDEDDVDDDDDLDDGEDDAKS